MEFGYPLNDVEYTAEQAGAYFACRTSGVFPGETNLAVSITAARQLTVSPGVAWFRTEDTWGKVYCNTANKTISLPTADGVLKRIVRVIVRWNKATNTFTAQLIQGALSSNPIAPQLSRTDEMYDLCLAEYLIEAGETEAQESRLSDKRADETLCGYTSDGVERIPTATLQSQFDAWLELLRNAYDDVIHDIVPPHASTHEIGGDDPITPSGIGAASALSFTNTSVSVASWEEDETYPDFGYAAEVSLTGVTASTIPEVVFGVADASSGIFAPCAEAYDGGVKIYASEIPDSAITIPTILCWRV